ncbi:MAG: hypothetical protein V3W51_04605 [Candidatus Brocadiales bacterium]
MPNHATLSGSCSYPGCIWEPIAVHHRNGKKSLMCMQHLVEFIWLMANPDVLERVLAVEEAQ